MKRLLLTLLLVAAATFGTTAKNYTVDSVPNVQVADQRRFVSNPDGILSPEAVYTIDTMLYRLRTSGVAEVAVVAVESIGFDEPREFATSLFRHWGLGDKEQNNGLLVLLVLGQGAIEIETGYGIEGDLPDAVCKRVIERVMIPHFKARNFDDGMVEGVGALAEVLRTREVPEELRGGGNSKSELIGLCVAFGAVVIFVVLICILLALHSRCPKCKKYHSLKRTGERIEISRNSFQRVYKVAYKCTLCGHVVWRNEAEDVGGHHRGGGGGPIIFGGGGFGGRGGGGFGGGFGGGMSGGGGAGGRF